MNAASDQRSTPRRQAGSLEPGIDASSPSFALLNNYQRVFPLIERPYHWLSEQLGLSPQQVMATLSALIDRGAIQRIGAAFRPNAIGRSMLAAMSVDTARLEAVAAHVSAHPNVNHNYAREHPVNLWFVATANSASSLARTIDSIEGATCHPVLRLPLVAQYHIDLGFDLIGSAAPKRPVRAAPSTTTLSDRQWRLVQALQGGLPLVDTPYAQLGSIADMPQKQVLATLHDWVGSGVIQRFGVIVRHHELGYRANAMSVWDVPDDEVDAIGRALAREPAVTLCYRRTRAAARRMAGQFAPAWPYNLYCMVHGRERDLVRSQIAALTRRYGLERFAHAVLFSTRRFKQIGARYVHRIGAEDAVPCDVAWVNESSSLRTMTATREASIGSA